MSKSVKSDIPLPPIVVWLRIVGVLTPIAGLAIAGSNANSPESFPIFLVSLIGSLLCGLRWVVSYAYLTR